MRIVYGKVLSESENSLIKVISKECGIMFDTARLLFYRGIDSVEKAKRFLTPSKSNFNNPFLLSGMKEAVERIRFAKDNKEPVLIWGDYDADGICASSTLYYSLKQFGIDSIVKVPERNSGYGLNVEQILSIHKEIGIKLLITVDCGISENDKIEIFKSNGIDVIVTDHHEPPEVLPDCIKINPHIEGDSYPFKELCGAGVAYKLSYALIGEEANKYLDLVALATVSDSMNLVSENRDIVVEGLKLFNGNNCRKAFKYLAENGDKVINSQTLAFSFAPRINAGGRMGDANSALKLFLAENENEIYDLSVKLNEYNLARQVECDRIYREAKSKIQDNVWKEAITVYDESWQVGFIGIVAARLVEDYNRPVIVFGGYDGVLKGSARSVDSVNIYQAICGAKEFTIEFGGHSQAAGVSITKDNFENFSNALCDNIRNVCEKDKIDKEIFVDWQINGEISSEFAKEIDLLEPFGVGNKKPLFSVLTDKVCSLPLKSGSQHYKFLVGDFEVLDFNGEENVLPLSISSRKDVIFEINRSVFKNREYVKGYLKYIVSDYNPICKEDEYKLFNAEIRSYRGSLTKGSLKTSYNNYFSDKISFLDTSREVFARIFNKILKFVGKKFLSSTDFYLENRIDEDAYEFIFCMEVFLQLNIFYCENGFLRYNKDVKNSLTNSLLYVKICAEKK